VALAVVVVLAAGSWPEIADWVAARGAWGAVAFGVLFVVLTVGCFPVSVLGVTAGMLWGPWRGLALVYGSAYLSGMLMFALGRSAIAPLVARLVARNRRLRGLDAEATDNALRLNILARLSPFNYGLVCYTLAAGRSRWPAYLLGLLAAIPSMAAQVWVGHLLAGVRTGVAASGDVDLVKTAVKVVGAAALLLLVWQLGRMVRRSWRSADERPEDHERR
jgi:uncharacterized membrane protein YdjX (TVP38/TMEM64 family)